MKILRLFLALAFVAVAQEPLTNDSIVKMVKSGLGENVILSMVKGQPAKYTLAPDDLIALKAAGVPDSVVAAMVEKSTGGRFEGHWRDPGRRGCCRRRPQRPHVAS
jgi:hypothetical protein